MTTSTQTPLNWSIHAIPVAYGLGLAPYMYQFARGMTASRFQATNVLPRMNLELLKGKIPEATWASIARARGAHLNALEIFPMFAVAMVAGNVARLPVSDLNSAASQFITARVVYSLLYITTTSEVLSYLRTGAFAWSLSAPLFILWQAGNKFRSQGVDLKSL